MSSNQQARHLADSTLLCAVLSALDQERDSTGSNVALPTQGKTVDPARQISVSGGVFFEHCRSLYDQCGPERVFVSLHDALVDQWTPIGVVFGSADTPITTTKRLHAYERLALRSCISDITIIGDQSVMIRQVPVILEIAQTTCLSLAFWGVVTSAFRAAGCRGVRLDSQGVTLFANHSLNILAVDLLCSGEPVVLSWAEVKKPPASGCPRFRATCHRELIGSLVRLVYSAILDGQQVHLAEAAEQLGTSSRTLQRRLSDSNISLRSLQRSLQLFVATGLLADPDYSVTDIAMAARFADAPHLIRKFRAATGMTPRAFADRLMV